MEEEKKAERFYSVETVSIQRDWSNKQAFTASIGVKNQYGNNITIKLPEDRVLDLIDSVADLVVESLNTQFKNMREEMLAQIEEKKRAMLPPAVEGETVE